MVSDVTKSKLGNMQALADRRSRRNASDLSAGNELQRAGEDF